MDCSTPGLHVHHQLPEFTQIHVHWVGDAIQPSHPLSSPSPPTFTLSQYRGLFQWISSSHRWPKYWSFSFSISPSNEYSGLISFRIDWLDLLAVQGTLRSVWASPVEVWVGGGLPQGQGLWLQQTWLWHKPFWRRSPLAPPQSCQNLHGTGK